MLRAVNGHYYDDENEISQEEYELLRAAVFEKRRWVNTVFSGEASLDDVPEEWREEIAERVEQRRAEQELPEEISMEEALEIILGGAV